MSNIKQTPVTEIPVYRHPHLNNTSVLRLTVRCKKNCTKLKESMSSAKCVDVLVGGTCWWKGGGAACRTLMPNSRQTHVFFSIKWFDKRKRHAHSDIPIRLIGNLTYSANHTTDLIRQSVRFNQSGTASPCYLMYLQLIQIQTRRRSNFP